MHFVKIRKLQIIYHNDTVSEVLVMRRRGRKEQKKKVGILTSLSATLYETELYFYPSSPLFIAVSYLNYVLFIIIYIPPFPMHRVMETARERDIILKRALKLELHSRYNVMEPILWPFSGCFHTHRALQWSSCARFIILKLSRKQHI